MSFKGVLSRVGTEGPVALPIAEAVARVVLKRVRRICPADVVGSVRRARPECGDIDIVAVPDGHGDWERLLREFWPVTAYGDQIIRGRVAEAVRELDLAPMVGRQWPAMVAMNCEIYRATPANVGMITLVRTGSAAHNIYLAGVARSRGQKFNAASWVLDAAGRAFPAQGEEQVFDALGLDWVCPTKREVINGVPLWKGADGH